MPYGFHLEPGFGASKEATKKRKNGAGVGPTRKHAKVSDRKATTPKAPAAPKGAGAASSKAASSPVKSMPKAGATPRDNVSPKAGAPTNAVVPRSVATQAVPKARVLSA
jgi:hypothetical protein